MLKNKSFLVLFLLILIIGSFLRLYMITQVPPGVNRDEASIGFTASSLLKTGKDEYGRSFPLSFQSFGDWKLPFYIYETVVTVKLFGLNEFAVRLPSALAGIATVALVFFVAEGLFNNKKLSFLAMLLTAIAPWSIHMSRVESESNTAVFFMTLGMLFFLKGRNKKPYLLIFSAISFALSYFTYAGNYVFTTLFILGLIIFYGKSIPKTKFLWISIAVFILLSAFISFKTLGANHTKLSGISIFGDPSVIHAEIEMPRNDYNNPNSLIARVFHNRVIFAAERFLQNYANTFSANFLFINGGTNHAHNIENFGNMYIIEALFLFLGLVYLIALKSGKERNIILWWFFISPVAASITKDAPHTNRTFAIFPILPLILAFGLWWFISQIKTKYKKLAVIFIALLYLINVGVYLDRYYIHFPKNETQYWGNSYKKLVEIISQKQFANKHIIMSNPQTSPYIYLVFYQNYDPLKYQETAVRYSPTEDGFVHVKSFGRYEFRDIDWNNDLHNASNLLVDFSQNVPEFVRNDYKTTEILLPNSQPMFTIVQAK